MEDILHVYPLVTHVSEFGESINLQKKSQSVGSIFNLSYLEPLEQHFFSAKSEEVRLEKHLSASYLDSLCVS